MLSADDRQDEVQGEELGRPGARRSRPARGLAGALSQWRHVPDVATLQALGFSWCGVTAADAAFFTHITPGPPHPASSIPERADYLNCMIG